MKIAVLGKGAIGSLIAAQSNICHTPFAVWWRSNDNSAVTVSLKSGERITLHQSEKDTPDILILPLKAWQISPALKQLKPYINAQSCIVLLHNGLGTEEITLAQCPHNPIMRLTTSKAARKSGDQVYETGYGQSHGGWLRQPNESRRIEIEQTLARVLAPCQWHQDIYPALWQKLAINSVINPLTAVHQVKNGALADGQFRKIIDKMLMEFCSLCTLENQHFVFDELRQAVDEVIALTAENYSSMQQDIYYQRPTEIDFINGYLLKRAELHDINLPVNQNYYEQVKQLEVKTSDYGR